MSYQERFRALHGHRPVEEQFRLAWIYSLHPMVRRLHTISAIGGEGGERFSAMKQLAMQGFLVDPQIDGLGQDPLAVMQERRDRGIASVNHPADKDAPPALVLPVPQPYSIRTVTSVAELLERLNPTFDATVVFVGGQARPFYGELVGPKVEPDNREDPPEAGWYYPGLDDNSTTGAWCEVRRARFSKDWNNVSMAEMWAFKNRSQNPFTE